MKRWKRGISLLFSVCLATAALAAPAELPLPEPRGERIRISGGNVAAAARQIAGRGIEGIEAQAIVDRAGRELVWKEVRKEVDEEGNTHRFYRQYLAGTEVFGSEVVTHANAAGKIWSVSGMQYRDVLVANGISLDRESALDAAAFRLLAKNSTRVRKLDEMNAELRERALGAANLKLVQKDGVFRYVWFTQASDAKDRGYQIVIDADTEEIVSVSSTSAGGNCVPTGPLSTVSATGIPVRTGVPNRSIKAHPATDRPAPYTHEGYWHSVPYKWALQQTWGDYGLWMCDTTKSYSWAIIPLKTENSVVVYKDWPGEQWKGSAAGDAIYHSDLANRYFKFIHGRNGWNNNYADVKILVESQTPAADQAAFNSNTTTIAPQNSVMIGPAGRFYNAGASLDWMAHEWGHGVVNTSANFPYSGTGAELHEGFADVIGHMVERYYHPIVTGNPPKDAGLEKADWVMHEDAAVSGYARGAVDDGASHDWTGPNYYNGGYTTSYNDLLHAGDTPVPTGAPLRHARANMLAVVLRLLTDGGTNPVCARLSLSGCSTNVPAQGSKAARIMFRALTSTLPSNSTWESLADNVADAAFSLYNQCSVSPLNNATAEQQAVFAAFRAIGYGSPTEALNTCP
ncbi:MAG TPA: M4 family metallopeptidase [Thermoanaerobaculia bacterium]|jgi:hypothetical protein